MGTLSTIYQYALQTCKKAKARRKLGTCILIISQFVMLNAGAQGVGINATGAGPDASAGLDVDFINKGMLVPRMTAAQRNQISSPARGLVIYNLDCDNFNYYNGSAWVSLNNITAAVNISALPGGAVCAGTSVTYTAAPVNGGSSPSYQWKVNGVSVGTNSATYTYTPANADVIICELTSNASCVTGSPAISNTITAVVTTVPAAAISYSGTPYCSTINIANVSITGTSGGTYSSAAGLSINSISGIIDPSSSVGGNYTVTYTIPASGGCSQVTATTPVTITTLPVASFSYPATPYCADASNPSPVFSGGGVAGVFSSTSGLSFVSNSTGEVDIPGSSVGSYTVTNTIAAAGGCPQVTANSPIGINAVPASTFSPSSVVNSATFNPTVTGASYSWVFPSGSPGTSNAQNPLVSWSSAGTYNVSLTVTQNGCSSTTTNGVAVSTCGEGTGGVITHVNGKTIHTFNADGNFTIDAGCVPAVEVLVVGGGGGGGYGGSGGGAGGYRYNANYAVSTGTYPITVGSGGNGGVYGGWSGSNGGNSVFGTITSLGGGYGGGEDRSGGTGGSGGGGGCCGAVAGHGTGGQGNDGGANGGVQGSYPCGGGGGAGGTGGSGYGSVGGAGLQNSISGTPTYYAGGGGGGSNNGGAQFSGGSGGGGNGGTPGTAGTANTGGGGGGGNGNYNGGAGGSGVVIISYVTP